MTFTWENTAAANMKVLRSNAMISAPEPSIEGNPTFLTRTGSGQRQQWHLTPGQTGIETVLLAFVARRIMKVSLQRPGVIEVKGGSALAVGKRAQALDWLPVRARIVFWEDQNGDTRVEASIWPRGRPHVRRRLFEALYEQKLSSWPRRTRPHAQVSRTATSRGRRGLDPCRQPQPARACPGCLTAGSAVVARREVRGERARHHVRMIARVALGLVAAVVLAWLTVMLVVDHDLSEGSKLPAGGLPQLLNEFKSPQQFNARLDLLRRARFLTPDTAPELVIARYYMVRNRPGDTARALKIVESILRREPQNLNAWVTIDLIQEFRHDPGGQRAAVAHIHRLDPLERTGF